MIPIPKIGLKPKFINKSNVQFVVNRISTSLSIPLLFKAIIIQVKKKAKKVLRVTFGL